MVARTKLLPVFSMHEAKIKVIEWAASCAIGKSWNMLSFSSNAQIAVNEINSSLDPLGWHTRNPVLCIRYFLLSNGLELVWNVRASNKFADSLEKLVMTSICNFMFFSSNLDRFFKDLSDIYVADIVGSWKV